MNGGPGPCLECSLRGPRVHRKQGSLRRPVTGLGAFGSGGARSLHLGGGMGKARHRNRRALVTWGAPRRGLERFVLGPAPFLRPRVFAPSR